MTWKFRNLYKLSSLSMKLPITAPSGGGNETGIVIYKNIEESNSQSLEDNTRNYSYKR